MKRPAFLPDDFTLMLIATVALATLLPAQGGAAHFFDGFTTFAIGLLFFLQGARLSQQAVIRAGMTHWRLHRARSSVARFVLFPRAGPGASMPLVAGSSGPSRSSTLGVLFLCMLPARPCSPRSPSPRSRRGNIAGRRVQPRPPPTILGIAVTPLLVSVLRGAAACRGGQLVRRDHASIVLQLLLPFGIGHALATLAQGCVDPAAQPDRWASVTTDRSSILLVVYTCVQRGSGIEWHLA